MHDHDAATTDPLLLGLPCLFVMGLSQTKERIRLMAFLATRYLGIQYECIHQAFQLGESDEIFATGACICLQMFASWSSEGDEIFSNHVVLTAMHSFHRSLMTALRDYPATYLDDPGECIRQALESDEVFAAGAYLSLQSFSSFQDNPDRAVFLVHNFLISLMTALRDYRANRLLVESALSSLAPYHLVYRPNAHCWTTTTQLPPFCALRIEVLLKWLTTQVH
jgi:hypothetical protein